jgi:hypothetical protein
MEFILPFQIRSFPFKISYIDKILFIGSCFSEEIGNKMCDLKFDVLQNPNGILYDPISITDALFSYIEKKPFDEENLVELNGLWHSWKHHSVFSGVNKKEVLQKINTSINELPIEEMKTDLLSVISALELFNSELKIIFTVSPVKHIKDGIVENNRSKSRLIEAALVVADEKENVFYFPAYELVTDVLRDYRFYKNDLVHPNATAIDFVFEKFSESLFDKHAKELRKEIEKIILAVNHTPFLKESEAHQKFIASQIQNIKMIEIRYPFLNLSKEKKSFEE